MALQRRIFKKLVCNDPSIISSLYDIMSPYQRSIMIDKLCDNSDTRAKKCQNESCLKLHINERLYCDMCDGHYCEYCVTNITTHKLKCNTPSCDDFLPHVCTLCYDNIHDTYRCEYCRVCCVDCGLFQYEDMSRNIIHKVRHQPHLGYGWVWAHVNNCIPK